MPYIPIPPPSSVFAELVCIIVLDKNHKVIYTEQVDEITTEPNYETALAVLS